MARPPRRPDHVPGVLEVLIEERVPVFSIGMGNPPKELVERFHAYGAKVVAMVSTPDDARAVAANGVDAVIAQGAEAGGHRSSWVKPPTGQHAAIGTFVLVPEVVDAVDVPVIAAGGVTNGRSIAAALALGASGVLVGTRFVATREARAADYYKDQLVARGSDATVITDAYTGLYARLIRNSYITEYEAANAPVLSGYLQSVMVRDIVAAAAERRDLELYPMWAGQGIGMIHEIPAAADVMESLVQEARRALIGLERRVQDG